MQQPDDLLSSISADTVNAAVAASSDVGADMFRVLQLKERNAEMLESVRSHGVDQAALDFSDIVRPWTLRV